MNAIRVGTLLKGPEDPSASIASLSSDPAAGIESWSIVFWETIGSVDLPRLADGILAAIHSSPELPGGGRAVVSALSVYGNPLRDDETGEEIRRSWRALIDCAPRFAASPGSALDFPIVSGFAGRVPGSSVEASLPAWRSLFSGLADRAEKNGLRLAFENCRMGDSWKTGKWNIAINPDAWELMFTSLDAGNLGLEWEPCHQVEALADPLPQLEAWAPRVFHVHGKDAHIDRALLAANGLYGRRKFHASRLPGRGDTDWKGIFRVLDAAGYSGCVDVEGWNDDGCSGDGEIQGQIRAMAYLKDARVR